MFMMGLIDVEKLHLDCNRSGQKRNRSGQKVDWSGCGQPLVSHQSGGGQPTKNGVNVNGGKGFSVNAENFPEKPLIPVKSNGQSKRRILLTEHISA